MTRAVRVRAAGGVVVRGIGDETEVLLVHRQRYDDWSLPKGKVDPGESEADAAVREVFEETGYRCSLGDRVDCQPWYVDNQGRSKSVSYWIMTVIDGGFAPNSEVDAIRWCSPAEAAQLLSYAYDVAVVVSALAQHRA